MAFYHSKHKDRGRIEIRDPETGEKLDQVDWADTDWGLLKIWRRAADGRGRAQTIEFSRDGRAHFRHDFDLIRRSYDIVDSFTRITLHRIRVRGEYTYDLLRG